MNQYLGLAIAYLFIFICMAIASALNSRGVLTSSTARKLIHIAVGHWWFIAMYSIVTPWVALIGPASFILINLVIARAHLLPAMESEGSNMGTVYYPISLLILVLMTWFWGMPKWIGGLGIMVMAWGDGMAAIIGQSPLGSRRHMKIFGNTKSLAGSIAMVAASFTVALVMQILFLDSGDVLAIVIAALGLALAAGLVELVTPFGLDNISVPLLSSLGYWIFYSQVFS